mgnify:CR=1 FL=1
MSGEKISVPAPPTTLLAPRSNSPQLSIRNAPLVPVFVFREGRRRYRVELRSPIEVARTDDKQRDVQDGVARMAEACEQALAQFVPALGPALDILLILFRERLLNRFR